MKYEGDYTTKKERMSKKPSASKSRAMERMKQAKRVGECPDCGNKDCTCK